MANVSHKEFYEATKKEHPFTPFAAHKLPARRRVSHFQPHERDSKYWRATVAHMARDPAQLVNLKAWFLYLIRFIRTAGICNDWEVFGVLSAPLPRPRIALHLGVTENAAVTIPCDWEMRHRLQRLARSRDTTGDFDMFLSGDNDGVKRYLKSDLGKGRHPAIPQSGGDRKVGNTFAGDKKAAIHFRF